MPRVIGTSSASGVSLFTSERFQKISLQFCYRENKQDFFLFENGGPTVKKYIQKKVYLYFQNAYVVYQNIEEFFF